MTFDLSVFDNWGKVPVAPEPSPPDNVFRWGTVTSSSPLAVRLDGDSAPLASVPDSLLSYLPEVGERVWCQLYRRRVVVLGSATGDRDIPWTPLIPVNGFTVYRGAAPPRACMRSGIVFLEGLFGFGSHTAYIVTYVPEPLRPETLTSNDLIFPVVVSDLPGSAAVRGVDGAILTRSTGGVTSGWISFDTVSYPARPQH